MIRLFITEPAPAFAQGLAIALNPDQSRYLAAVMRLHEGDEILVFNGRDGEWLAAVTAIGKKSVTLELKEMTRSQPERAGPVLAVALVKRSALETIVEKATELGVGTIQLVITQRTNASHTNVERLVSIASGAAEQTERLDVPTLLTPVKLDHWLSATDSAAILFGDEDSTHEGQARLTRPLLECLQQTLAGGGHAPASVAVLIGPEGGFDDAERSKLRADPRVHPVNLGPRILRADTAAISALTLVQAVLGDWR